jgi:NADH-quinone oxidoreductase subunit B
MGACAISGGPFKQGYNVLKGIDRFLPVDLCIPGCPPRPEAFLNGLVALQKMIQKQKLSGPNRPRHMRKEISGEYPVPEYGAHDLEPGFNPAVWRPLKFTREE